MKACARAVQRMVIRREFLTLLLVSVLIGVSAAYAQGGKEVLSGRVIDQEGEPIVGAVVHLPQLGLTVTDAQGIFTIGERNRTPTIRSLSKEMV